MNKKINIAIDGPSGVGKSSVAQELAKQLAYTFINTGSYYRGIALFYQNNRWDLDTLKSELDNLFFKYNENGALTLNSIVLKDNIRSQEIAKIASQISKDELVREHVNKFVIELVKTKKGFVLEGRDTTFRVAPNAEVRVFLTANDEVRALRRTMQNAETGSMVDYKQVLIDVKARDLQDTTRKVDPLHVAPGVIVIDNTELTLDETREKIMELVQNVINQE